MSFIYRRAMLRASCFALACGGTVAQAAEIPTEGLIFHAPFDNNTGVLSGPNDKPKGIAGDFPFVEGKIGGAIRTGSKDSFLLYDGSNLSAAEGTVSLWLRPQWNLDAEKFHMFWSMRADGQFTLYKHASGKSLVFYIQGKGATEDQATTIQTSIEDWKKDEWHHIAISWSAGNAGLYVDGVLKKSINSPNLSLPAIGANTSFFIGDYYHRSYGTQSGLSGEADADIDDFRIYDRVLTAAQIRDLAGKEAPVMTPPQTAKVVVPKTSAPPKIDGSFTYDEWKDATAFSGFFDITTGKLTDRQTTVLLTYDDENLYMATVAPLIGGTLQTTANGRDSAVYTDDSVEIYLDPTKSRQPNKFVQFIGNYNGAILDVKDGDNSWQGNWQFKNTLTNFNGLGTNYWVTEIAIPFKDLGANTPKNGEEWTANFARSWVAGQQTNTSWSWLVKQQYATPERFGTLEFSDKAPAFQWTELRDLITGQPTISGTFNQGATAKMQVSLAGAATSLATKDLKADEQKAAKWTSTLDLSSSSADTLKLEVRDGNRVLYASEMPYALETEPLRMFVSPIPSQNRLIVDVDPLQFRRQWKDGWKVEVKLQDKAAKTVATKSISAYKPPFARTEFDLSTIPVGDYNIVATLHDSTKQVAEKTTAFVKPATPKWVNSQVGISDKVLKPWIPIVTTPTDLKLWGRQYSFGKNALPQQINSLEKPLLRAPVRFVVDGSPLPESANAKYVKTTDAKAERAGSSSVKGWNLDWKSETAFDGVIWYEVTVSPQQGAKKTLDSFALEIPMRGDASSLYVTGSSGMSGEAGATPANWQSSWVQGFWLGNEKMGLSWFAESDQHWSNADPKKVVTFTRDANQTLARVNFVSKALDVQKPVTYKFGLMATPSRPMPTNWRSWQFSSGAYGANINVDPEKPTHGISWWMNWSPYISAPYDILPKAKEVPAAFHKAGAKAIPYNALTVVNDAAKDFSYYRAEWMTNPVKAIGGEAGVDQQSWQVSPNSSYADYMLYGLRENVRNEKWDGHYFDFDGGASPDTNEFHGSGYVNEQGERRPTYDIRSHRSFHQRLWHMLQEELKTDEPSVMVHNSQSLAPYIHSFANLWLDGEQFNFSPKVDDDYTKVITRDQFRAEFLGTNFGSVVLMMPQLGLLQERYKAAPAGPQKDAERAHFQKAIDTFILYPMMHGTLFYPSWLDMEYLRPIYEGRRALDMGTARFYGYWENENLVKLTQGGAAANPDVLPSIYAQDDRFWLVVGNWTAQPQVVNADAQIEKIAPKLKSAQAKANSFWKDGSLSQNGNRIQMTVPPKSIRIIEIK